MGKTINKSIKEKDIDIINKIIYQYNYNSNTGVLSKGNIQYTSLSKDGRNIPICLYRDNVRWEIAYSRVCWLLFYNELPPDNMIVDHIDRVRNNNKIDNLRLATKSQNSMNKCKISGDKYKGIFKYKGNYTCSIGIDGISYKIGTFNESCTAAIFYDSASRFYFKEFAHTNFDISYIEPKSIDELKILAKLYSIDRNVYSTSINNIVEIKSKLNSNISIKEIAETLKVDRNVVSRIKNQNMFDYVNINSIELINKLNESIELCGKQS